MVHEIVAKEQGPVRASNETLSFISTTCPGYSPPHPRDTSILSPQEEAFAIFGFLHDDSVAYAVYQESKIMMLNMVYLKIKKFI